MQTTGQAASTGGASAAAPQKEALYLRCHCASRRNALDRALPVDRASEGLSESESLVLDARSGIGGQDPTHDAAAARRRTAANHRRERMACLGVDGAGEVKSR